MARLPRKTNYTKLVYQANKTKSKVKTNQIEAYAKWQKKLGKKSVKLDALDDKLRKLLKDIEKQNSDDEKALRSLLRLVEGAHKELQTYKQVPVPGKVPPPPKNITALSSLALVVIGYIAYVATVKTYMAMCEALSKKDA